MPVEFIDKDSAGGVSGARLAAFSSNQTEQLAIQEASILGQVVGYAIDNPGSGYSSAPTLTITGDGSSAIATATISGGAVVKVIPTEDGSGNLVQANFGSGYNFASVTVSGGSPDSAAIIRPILSTSRRTLDSGGLGDDPVSDLRSNALMFNAKPSGAERADFFINQQFRQVGLLKNPELGDSTSSPFTEETGNTLRTLNLHL